MVDEKHLDPAAADRIGEFVRMSGGIDLVEKLTEGKYLILIPICSSGCSTL